MTADARPSRTVPRSHRKRFTPSASGGAAADNDGHEPRVVDDRGTAPPMKPALAPAGSTRPTGKTRNGPISGPRVRTRPNWLGYLDSNQEQLNQNQPCCQLHHTPMVFGRSKARRADAGQLYRTRSRPRKRAPVMEATVPLDVGDPRPVGRRGPVRGRMRRWPLPRGLRTPNAVKEARMNASAGWTIDSAGVTRPGGKTAPPTADGTPPRTGASLNRPGRCRARPG